MILIAFGHKARVGKDTAAAILLKHYSRSISIRRYAFADELKRQLGIIPGAVLTVTERRKCQALGASMRKNDPEYWIKCVDALIRYAPPDVALVTDMRYYNEFAWIRGMGGRTVKLIRPGAELDKELAAHLSENELSGMPDGAWDKIIEAHSVPELEEKILQWFSAIIVPQLELAGLIRQDETVSLKGDRHANVLSPAPARSFRN